MSKDVNVFLSKFFVSVACNMKRAVYSTMEPNKHHEIIIIMIGKTWAAVLFFRFSLN